MMAAVSMDQSNQSPGFLINFSTQLSLKMTFTHADESSAVNNSPYQDSNCGRLWVQNPDWTNT